MIRREICFYEGGGKDEKKSTNVDQSTRFIEAARAAGASDDEAVFDANLKKIATASLSSPQPLKPEPRKHER